MQIFTRKGSATDSEVLQALELEARSSLDTFRGGSRMGDEQALVGEGWSREVSNSEVVVFVGGVDKVVMGYLLARRGAVKTGAIATIEQVFVTKDARNFGIGDALITSSIEWAKGESLVALDGVALPGDRETKNLYERSGLVARLITVTTDLQN